MSLTYSAQVGVTVTSAAMNETLGSQTQQTGNNTVVVSDDIVTLSNGQLGDGTNGVGGSYVGREVVIDLGLSTEQRRQCTAETAGTGTTMILTVHEDWVTNPVATTDTIHVAYEYADILDGLGNGIDLNTKSGYWELSNFLTIANGGLLFSTGGQALELSDEGTSVAFTVQSGGYYHLGYETSGRPVGGGLIVTYNNAAGEPSMQCQSGSTALLYDSLIFAQREVQQLEFANGSDVTLWNMKLLNMTDEGILYDATCKGSVSLVGKGGTTEIIRVDAGTTTENLILENVDTLDSAADTTTETLTINGFVDIGTTDIITLRNNKTWNMIDPIWGATLYSDFNDTAVTGTAAINEKRSVSAIVQKADGTKLQDALAIVYENTLADLVLELTTDANGEASGSFNHREHSWTSGTGSTTTRSGHSLQCGKWLYKPFVAAQLSTEAFDGTIVLAPDNDIVQTTQATAKSDGSGITWNEETNPSETFAFTSGSGTGLAGMILTFSPSGATGTITEFKSGDSSAGTLHLKTRNGIAIANGDTFSRTGGTAGTFSGTYTNGSKRPYSIYIDGNAKSYQTIYDYLAAIQTETTLTADGEKIWEWCRHDQGQPLYHTGSSFYTERSNAKGIIVINAGAGSVDYYTSDNGLQWVPPATVTLQLTVRHKLTNALLANVRCSIHKSSDHTELLNTDTNGSGVASASYTYTGDTAIYWRVRESPAAGNRYQAESGVGTITSSGYENTVLLTPEPVS